MACSRIKCNQVGKYYLTEVHLLAKYSFSAFSHKMKGHIMGNPFFLSFFFVTRVNNYDFRRHSKFYFNSDLV